MPKRAIPQEVRRAVALRAGATPGEGGTACCDYCGKEGSVYWPRLSSGKPGSWVMFPGLELDHRHPEFHGGEASEDNITLACQPCNRRKGARLGWAGVSTDTCGENVEAVRSVST